MEKASRHRLIEAATPLFARKGFAAVSIRELAEAAELNSALISYHFGGKEGLYAAVLECQYSPILPILQEFKDSELNPVEKINCYARGICRLHRRSPYFARLMMSELTNPTGCSETVIKKYISQLYRELYQNFLAGVASGDFCAELNPGHATISLAGIMNFYFVTKPLFTRFTPAQSADDDEQYLLQAVNIYLHGVRRINYE